MRNSMYRETCKEMRASNPMPALAGAAQHAHSDMPLSVCAQLMIASDPGPTVIDASLTPGQA
jgi:hypothetical protein